MAFLMAKKLETITQLQGIGQTQNPEQSSNKVYWKDGDGHELFVHTLFFIYL